MKKLKEYDNAGFKNKENSILNSCVFYQIKARKSTGT